MIESLIRKYNDDEGILPEIVLSLEKLEVNELISIYLGYSSSVYFLRYPNIANILNLMCDKIGEKLDTISPLTVIEIYTDIYLKTLETTERVGKNRNFIRERSSRLQDETFIENEAKRRNVSREVFLDNYVLGTKNPQRDLESYELALKHIERLHTKIFNYLENKLKSLTDLEREEVLNYLQEKIKENDKEIARREDILHDESKIRLLLNYGQYGNSRYDVCLNLDPTEFKIKNEDVYKSLQAMVLDNVVKK